MKAHVEVDPPTLNRRVWIWQPPNYRAVAHLGDGDSALPTFEWVEQEPGTVDTPPTIVIPGELWEALEEHLRPAAGDTDALSDTREVRDRLLELVERQSRDLGACARPRDGA